jgi:hypothetical protein
MDTKQQAIALMEAIPGEGAAFVEEAIFKSFGESEACLAETFRLLHSQPSWRRGATYRDVLTYFDEVAYFLEDSEIPMLAGYAQWRVKIASGQAFADRLLDKYNGCLDGVQLKSRGMYAVLLKDATQPGRVRASFFNERGFFCHTTRDDYPTLLKELVEDGYTEECPKDTLDSMFMTDSFQAGMRQAYEIQRASA